VLSVIGLPLTHITIDWPQILPKALVLLLLALLGWFYHWRQEERLRDTLLCAFWFILLSNLYLLPMYMAARRDVGLSDDLLAQLDSLLGVEASQIALFTKAHPLLETVSSVVYLLLGLLMLLAVLVPPLRGEAKYTEGFAVSVLTAAVLSIPLLLVFQAMGPWHLRQLPPDELQLQFKETFLLLKQDGWFVINFQNPPGLMTFPSFHVILSVLSVWALRTVPYLRWPAAVLGALVCLTTLTTGWHYLVDILGGLLISVVCIKAEGLYLRQKARSAAQ
jgi:PAP2 superfamily